MAFDIDSWDLLPSSAFHRFCPGRMIRFEDSIILFMTSLQIIQAENVTKGKISVNSLHFALRERHLTETFQKNEVLVEILSIVTFSARFISSDVSYSYLGGGGRRGEGTGEEWMRGERMGGERIGGKWMGRRGRDG